MTMTITHHLVSILVLASLLGVSSTHATVISCLARHSVNNFTTFPTNNGSEPDNLNYYKLLNFSIQNLRFAGPAVPKPALIVLPGSADEVANAVNCCKESALGFRVRCGGHSYEGTSSVSFNGAPFVVIDLMNLNRVRVDVRSETAWVEGGATLGQTYYAISEASGAHGFSAGSCPTVGAGGHVSGGGYGFLSRKYGLAADNVVDALIVDARGRVLDREGMGEEVFWAIRGGGGGVWGVVLAWKIKLLKVPKTVTSFVVSRQGTKQAITKLIDTWQHVAPRLDKNFYLSAFLGAGLPEAKGKIGISTTFNGLYLGNVNDAISILDKEFPELEIVAHRDCHEMTWIESVLFFSGVTDTSSTSALRERYRSPQDRDYFKAKSDYVRTPIPITGIRKAIDILEHEPKGHIIMDPYGGIMDEISCEAIAFPHRKGNLYSIQYMVEWTKEDQNKGDEYINWMRGFYDSMAPYVSSGPRAAYINYMDLDLGTTDDYHGAIQYRGSEDIDFKEIARVWGENARVWGEKYFLKNYDRLVKAKTIIDPDNVFNNQQGIPPMSSIL